MDLVGPRYIKGELSKTQLEELAVRNIEDVLRVISAKVRALTKIVMDPVADFQILSAIRKGPLGTKNLNALVQNIFNPAAGQGELVQHLVPYRTSDKVVHVKNKTMLTVPMGIYMERGFTTGAAAEARIFNGMVGLIVDIDTFNKVLFVEYDDKIVVRYEAMELGDILELGYAITVHKSQGKEYLYTIIPVVSQHYVMISGTWLYAALTRAKSKAVCVGSPAMFKRACKSQDNKQRSTVLAFLLAQDCLQRSLDRKVA